MARVSHGRTLTSGVLSVAVVALAFSLIPQSLFAQSDSARALVRVHSLMEEGTKHFLHGDLDNSLTAYTSALEYARSKFGPAHWSTVVPTHRMEVVKAAIAGDDGQRLDLDRACVAWRQSMLANLRGDDEKAKSAAEDALRLCRKSVLQGTLSEADILGELSGYYKKSRQYKEEADADYARLALYSQIAGSVHRDTIAARLNYAGSATHTERIYEVEEELDRVLLDLHALSKTRHDESDTIRAQWICEQRRGSCHSVFGRRREALRCYQDALTAMMAEPRTENVPREPALRSLIAINLGELGSHAEAAAEMAQVLRLMEQSDADTANDQVVMLLRAGRVAYLAGSVPEEAKYVAQAQQIAAKQKGDEVPSESFDPSLTALYMHQGEYGKAAIHGHRWLKLVQRLCGTEHPFTKDPLQAVMEIETKLGHAQEASELQRVLQKIESNIARYEEARTKRLNNKTAEQKAPGN